MIGDLASRAASREATTVEEEVTFCLSISCMTRRGGNRFSYDGWDSKLVLLSVVEELQDIVADDDTALAGENVFGTHCVFAK
jgi:hypothetical protein